jgi:hypothetical protein
MLLLSTAHASFVIVICPVPVCASAAGENESNSLLREINKQRQVCCMQCTISEQQLQCSPTLQAGWEAVILSGAQRIRDAPAVA